MALDPLAPLRYKGLALLPGGFGTSLAYTMYHNKDMQPFGEIVMQQLFNFWSSVQMDTKSNAISAASQFDQCRSFLSHKIAGYGMERVLYTLCKDATCLSPQLKDFFVTSPGGLLLALEEMSKTDNKPDVILDRHMIAFISVRESKMVDPHLGAVVSKDKKQQIVGIIRTLAAIQQRFSVGAVPYVCDWMISIVQPAIDRINNRDLRKKISAQLSHLEGNGNLRTLLDIVDNSEMMIKDGRAYALAKKKYYQLYIESETLSGRLKKKKDIGLGTGRQVAMMVSAVLSSILIVGFLIIYFTGD
jgi:hypothetical protein